MEKKHLLAVLALAILLLSGCSTVNNKYVPCCKRDGFINSSSIILNLTNNPQCKYVSSSGVVTTISSSCAITNVSDLINGTVRCIVAASHCTTTVASECTRKPGCVWNGTGCRVMTCSDIHNEADCNLSLCGWNGATCSGGSAHVLLPICVDDTPSSCINNRCNAMICGFTRVTALPPVASQDWNNDRSQINQNTAPAPVETPNDPELNLAGTKCEFKTMTKLLYDQVKASRGKLWVNSFRFGVGRSFSDFEESRYFFPPTDRACSASTGTGQKLRYVTYVNTNSTWCANYHNPAYYKCTENNLNFTNITDCRIWCKNESNCQAISTGGTSKYWCRETQFLYNGGAECKANCDIISDSGKCPTENITYPFLTGPKAGYMMGNDGKINDTYYREKLISEYRPAGVSNHDLLPFECSSHGQCLGGFCNSNFYLRGRFLNASNGQRIDSGCWPIETEDGGVALNCSDSYHYINSSGLVAKYRVFVSKVEGGWGSFPNARALSTGDYNWGAGYSQSNHPAVGFVAGSTTIRYNGKFFNPYYKADGTWTVNEYEETDLLFTKKQNVGGEGDEGSSSVYRIYVQAPVGATADQLATGPDIKLFKNCRINRTSHIGLYRVVDNNLYSTGYPPYQWSYKKYTWPNRTTNGHWNTGLRLGSSQDNLGPQAQPMRRFQFIRRKPVVTDSHIHGITPHYPSGTGEVNDNRLHGTWWIDPDLFTRSEGFKVESDLGIDSINAWVYELRFDENTTRIGDCVVSNSMLAPHFDVERVGWCEGCTYSTLASQELYPSSPSAESPPGKSQYLSYADQAKRYLQASVMPIFDAKNLYLTYADNTATRRQKPSYGAASLLCGYMYSPDTAWYKNPPKGASVFIIGNIGMLSNSASAAGDEATSPASGGGLNLSLYVGATGTPMPPVAYMRLNGDTTYINASDAGNTTFSLRGKGAILSRGMFLRRVCPMSFVALEVDWNIVGGTDPATGLSVAHGSALAYQNQTRWWMGAGGLFNITSSLSSFFYTNKEDNREVRFAKGMPDKYPNSAISIFVQNWIPTCQNGTGDANRTASEFEARMEFSRKLLATYGKPSIIRFHFPKSNFMGYTGVCNESYFLDYLFKRKGDMVDAGVLGITYDAWRANNSNPGFPIDNLLSGSPQETAITKSLVDSAGYRSSTPFCTLVNHSKKVIGLSKHTYGQKIYAENATCECERCDVASFATGTCADYSPSSHPQDAQATPQLYCNDGNICELNATAAQEFWNYYCPSTCVNYESCVPCGDVDANAWCRVEKNGRVWKTSKNYSDITDEYWDILAGLSAKDKCCIEAELAAEPGYGESPPARYTYTSKVSYTQRAEFIQYPKKGEEDIDCGRAPDTSVLSYCNVEIPQSEGTMACWKVD